jgi:2-keto-4-pentenoate hydratase/2-oxohepta-3-ene-1,7-dioic acid hydratase in catechol pathway
LTEKYFLRFKARNYTGAGVLIDGVIKPISGDMYGRYEIMNKAYDPVEVEFLPPCEPQKIICVGLNYADHADESTLDAIPEEPLLFFKPASSLIGHGGKIIKPNWVDRVDYEGEIAAVIGKTMRYVDQAEAQAGIFGYTCVNDVTARNMQKKDKQWTRPKGFDTFCPVGPYIAVDIDASALPIQTRLNGKVVQKSNTSLMMRQPAEVISYISKVMTLYPGDLISTGTPKGVGPVQDGDVVEVEIEKIGTLVNTVREE